MVSKAEQRVTNWLKGINDSILYRNPFKATTCTSAGNTVSGSSKTGAIRGKCWVKKQTANAAPIQVNTNGFNQTQVGVPVMVAEHTQTGELHIIEVLWTDAVATIGENAANNASLPVVPAQYQQGVVKAANIDALRVSHPDVAPYTSGLYLRVEAGLGPYGWRVREYVSVSTSLRPATASHRWWVLAYLDTDDTVKFTTTGSVETTTPLTGLLLDGQGVSTVAAADNITIPTDALPLAVFTLENGQTTITPANTRIEDWRYHFAQQADSSIGLPAFGAGVIKTLSSGVATAGSDRHLILAAESGTADDCIEISGLSVGDEVIVRADAGDTITLKHDDAGATDKIILYNNADVALTGDQTMKLVKTTSGKVVQPVDEKGTGGGSTVAYEETLASAGSFDTGANGIPQTGDVLEIDMLLRGDVAANSDLAYLLFNGDTTVGNYQSLVYSSDNLGTGRRTFSAPVIADTTAGNSPSNSFAQVHVRISGYSEASRLKTAIANVTLYYTSGVIQRGMWTMVWVDTDAINRIQVVTDNDPTNKFDVGSWVQIRIL
jgi:hypothetical protein